VALDFIDGVGNHSGFLVRCCTCGYARSMCRSRIDNLLKHVLGMFISHDDHFQCIITFIY
jgi:hypothetical protein